MALTVESMATSSNPSGGTKSKAQDNSIGAIRKAPKPKELKENPRSKSATVAKYDAKIREGL